MNKFDGLIVCSLNVSELDENEDFKYRIISDDEVFRTGLYEDQDPLEIVQNRHKNLSKITITKEGKPFVMSLIDFHNKEVESIVIDDEDIYAKKSLYCEDNNLGYMDKSIFNLSTEVKKGIIDFIQIIQDRNNRGK